MTKYIKLNLLLILGLFSFNSFADNELIIKNARIINPAAKPLKARIGYIIIKDGIISKIGYGQLKSSKKIPIYNAGYQYVIPGLIDSHNHIDTVLGFDYTDYAAYPELKKDYQKQLPRSYLYFGYTTIIDTNTSDRKAAVNFTANKTHPDLYTCDSGIMIENGYPMNYVPQNVSHQLFPNFLYDPNQKGISVNNPDYANHKPSTVVKRISNSNAICVKVFYEPGFNQNRNLPLPSLSLIKEVVSEAHKERLNVLIHANSLSAQQFSLNSGIDILAHGLWNWESYDGQAGLPPTIQKTLDKIVTKELGYQPTMQVIKGLHVLLNPTFLDDPQLAKVVPESLLNWYRNNEGQWYVREFTSGSTKPVLNKRLQIKEDQLSRVVNYLQKQHGNLLFGTDTPSGPTYGNPPGYNGYLEMMNWQQAGVSLSEILIAATIRNAQFFNLEDKYGSISVGKIANLVIMRKNPLNDISAYDNISTVILHGKIYNRNYFSAN